MGLLRGVQPRAVCLSGHKSRTDSLVRVTFEPANGLRVIHRSRAVYEQSQKPVYLARVPIDFQTAAILRQAGWPMGRQPQLSATASPCPTCFWQGVALGTALASTAAAFFRGGFHLEMRLSRRRPFQGNLENNRFLRDCAGGRSRESAGRAV